MCKRYFKKGLCEVEKLKLRPIRTTQVRFCQMQKEKLVYQCLRSWFDQPSNVELKEKMHKEIQLYFSSTISLLKMVLDKVMVFSYITKNSTKKSFQISEKSQKKQR